MNIIKQHLPHHLSSSHHAPPPSSGAYPVPPSQNADWQNQGNSYNPSPYPQDSQYQYPPPPQQQPQYPQQQSQYPQQAQYPPATAPPAPAFNAASQGSLFARLGSLPQVRVCQGVENLEVISGFETNNKYAVLDPTNGQVLFKCAEKSSTLAKIALGTGRSMDIYITDANGAAIMQITRPFKLWKKNVSVMDSTGRLMGTILKKFAVAKQIYHVMNGSDQVLYTIQGGPMINLGKSRKLSILNSQGSEVGYIQKEWGGFAKEMFTDADNFTISFPFDSSPETRALLVATTLFIDLTHFEK